MELEGEEPQEGSFQRAVLATAEPADPPERLSPDTAWRHTVHSSGVFTGAQNTAATQALGTAWQRRHSLSTTIHISQQFTLTFSLSWRAGAQEGHEEVFPPAPPPIHSVNSIG